MSAVCDSQAYCMLLAMKTTFEPSYAALAQLFANNRTWSAKMIQHDPAFFSRRSQTQTPRFFWIGCSDSRVVPNEILGLAPGELFVHRNIANLVHHLDRNFLAALEFAVDVLRVEHIIVCGHYGCGGVAAAVRIDSKEMINNWVMPIRHILAEHEDELSHIELERERYNRLSELNVIQQVMNVCKTLIIRPAWKRNQALSVHGWIYNLDDGLVRDLQVSVSSEGELETLTQIHALH